MPYTSTDRLPRPTEVAAPRFAIRAAALRLRDVLIAEFPTALGCLLALCTILWALVEYASYKAELSRAETERYVAEFQSAPVVDAWARLSRAWQVERQRQATLLEGMARLSGPAFQRALHNYQQFVLETIETHRLEADIETVRAFFTRLELCIRTGGCDAATAAAAFDQPAWQFRNQHYYYFDFERSGSELDRIVRAIAPRS